MSRQTRILGVVAALSAFALPASDALAGKLIKTELLFDAINPGAGQVVVGLLAAGKCGKGRTIELTDNGELVFIGENTGELTIAADSKISTAGFHTLVASVEERKIKVKGKKKTCAAATISETGETVIVG